MGVKKTVFGSEAERTNYYKLFRQWGEKYKIVPGLPYLTIFTRDNLFDWNALKTFTISNRDFNKLKKTSIDYTLCDDNDKPLVCIDFDGIHDGFNVGTEYRFLGTESVPYRREWTELKLKVAHGSFFPYFVVGYDGFEDFRDLQLTMVDGVIGEVLAGMQVDRQSQEGFKPEAYGLTQAQFDALDAHQRELYQQDWFDGILVEADMTHNPVSIKIHEMQERLHYIANHEWLWHPEPDPAVTGPERQRLLNKATYCGCRCWLHSESAIKESDVNNMGKNAFVTAIVWLPNFCVPFLGMPSTLAEKLSSLLAYYKATKNLSS
jgi:hypothetical protein